MSSVTTRVPRPRKEGKKGALFPILQRVAHNPALLRAALGGSAEQVGQALHHTSVAEVPTTEKLAENELYTFPDAEHARWHRLSYDTKKHVRGKQHTICPPCSEHRYPHPGAPSTAVSGRWELTKRFLENVQ